MLGEAVVVVGRFEKGSFCGKGDGVLNISVMNDGESTVVVGVFRLFMVRTGESGSYGNMCAGSPRRRWD